MSRALFLTVGSALTLAACAPHDIHPATHPIAPTALGLSTQPTPAIDAQWWRAFGDPQLDRIVTDALAGNPTLDQALARLHAAQAQVAGQRAGLLPHASGDAVVLEARPSERFIGGGTGKAEAIGNLTGSLTWNIDLFGRQAAAIRAAGAGARAAGYDVAAGRLAIAGAVAQAYLQMTQAETQAKIAQDTISTREGSLKLVQTQVRNQLASKLQVSAAETLLAQAREALTAAQRSRALATNALAALAGHGSDYAATIQPSRISLDAPPALPAILPADLLGRRPDIAAALARIDGAVASRQVARKAFYPNVNLIAFAGFQSFGLANLLTSAAATGGGGPAISLPFFEGGKLRADYKKATADLDLATASYNDSVVGAVREAADAITQVQSLAAERVQADQVVRGFSETKRLNGIRIKSGLESRLDIVDTDIRLLDARLTDTNIAAAQATQHVALIVALGGGFDAQQDHK